MKIQTFFKGLTWLVLLNLVIKPVWIFGIDRELQNTVGHEAYGSYFALLNLSIVLSFIADAGLTNMMNRRLAAGETLHMPQLIRLKLLLSLVYIGVIALFGVVSGISLWNILILATGIQLLNSFLVFFRNMITARQLFKTDAWISVVDKLIMIVVFGSYFYLPVFAGSVDLVQFLTYQLVITLVVAFIAALVAFKGYRFTSPPLKASVLLTGAVPFTAIIFFMSLHNRLDGFLLERIHPNGALEAGIYASAFRLLDAGNMVGYLVASFLVPFVAHNLNDKNIIEQTVIKLRHLLMIPGIAITVIVIAFAPGIYTLLYDTTGEYNVQVLSLCISVLPAYYLTHIYGSVLTARGLLRQFLYIIVFAAVINLVLNLILIPIYGAAGSCIAALISQYFCALLCFILCTQHEQFSYHFGSFAVYIITGILLFAVFYISKTSGIDKLIAIGIGCFVTALIMFVQYNRGKKFVTEPNN